MRSPNSSLICILVSLSSVLKVDLFWLWFGRKISGKKGEKYPIYVFCSTPLRLGEPKAKIFDRLIRLGVAVFRRSIASPRRTCKSSFVFSLPLILEIIYWIIENPNN